MSAALGVCYYPEHWPETDWADDARRMAGAGLTWVRIGEFAWSRIEPRPGLLEWGWLDRAIDTLARAGLKIVLCTPTATPPRWMLTRHPDMLATDASGHPRKFGSRRHYCFSHAGYRDEAVRIAMLMGARYGADARIAAWQIDNEYGCHDTVLSWSDAARSAFRGWLADRYGSVSALNDAWGNVFWSMEYGSFDEIDLPNLTVTEPNPAHVMAFRRFSSDQVVRFNRAQAAALRDVTDAALIHNYMGGVTEFDHHAVGADLDVASWDSYPLGFLMDRSGRTADEALPLVRQGDPDYQAFHHDLYRAVGRGRWWVMEQQPGPVNWAPWNTAPADGMVRLWTWEAFAHGAEVVSYFRWRQAPFAQEQMHSGLLHVDRSDAPGLDAARTVARELAEAPPSPQMRSPVALVFDYSSCWAWDTQPQGADFTYLALVFETYRALRRAGLSVDIVPADGSDLEGRRIVLAPGLFAAPDRLVASAPDSAHILVGPRAGSRTEEFRIPDDAPGIPGLDLRLSRVESMPPGLKVAAPGGGAVVRWREDVRGVAEASIVDASGAAILARQGRIAYLAGWPDDVLFDRVVAEICDLAGLATTPMPGVLRQRVTEGETFVFNYGLDEVSFGGRTIPGCGMVRMPREGNALHPDRGADGV